MMLARLLSQLWNFCLFKTVSFCRKNHGFLKSSGGTRLSLEDQKLRAGTGSALDAVSCPSPPLRVSL